MTNEFYGYILVSQIETVEAVSHLEKQVDLYLNHSFCPQKLNKLDFSKQKSTKQKKKLTGFDQKTVSLESNVAHLKSKCDMLEETINLLKKFVIGSGSQSIKVIAS